MPESKNKSKNSAQRFAVLFPLKSLDFRAREINVLAGKNNSGHKALLGEIARNLPNLSSLVRDVAFLRQNRKRETPRDFRSVDSKFSGVKATSDYRRTP
jgi:hypothetical protein